MTDLRQTKEWAEWLSRTGWVVEKIGSRGGPLFVYIRQVPLIKFSFLKLQRFRQQPDWDELARLKKKYHVFASALEPFDEKLTSEIKSKGYHLTRDAYLPTKTRVIDLTKSETQLIKEMSENFRRVIKRRNRDEVGQISAEDFFAGWKKWSKTLILSDNQFKKMVEVYKKKVEFWGIRTNESIQSAVMLLFTPDTCFYYQTWTSDAGRRHSEHVRLVWETIRRARQLKKKFYNFEGVQDKRFPLPKWEGFSEFKRRFGGEELAYPGCFSKWF